MYLQIGISRKHPFS